MGSQPVETQSTRTIIGNLEGSSPPHYPLDIQATSDTEKLVPISAPAAADVETLLPQSLASSSISGEDNMVAVKTEGFIDHYLPQELSSNSLDEDHGV